MEGGGQQRRGGTSSWRERGRGGEPEKKKSGGGRGGLWSTRSSQLCEDSLQTPLRELRVPPSPSAAPDLVVMRLGF